MPQADDRRVRQLFESAGQAFARGRAQEAERLLRQAEAEAPQHPLVLNESARRLIVAGNYAGAHGLLDQALKAEPSNPSIWMNLAGVMRGLKRPDEEMAALQKVLALEPRDMRAMLQAATLHELRGEERAAAAAYRKALQMLPRGVEPPRELRPILDHAKATVEANEAKLEGFLEDRLKELRARHADESLARFDRCLDTLLRKRRIYRPQPTFMYFPNLPAFEFYDRDDFPWLDSIEAATDDIRAELISVLADGPSSLQPYISQQGPQEEWRELNNSRRWGVFYFWQAGIEHPENTVRCPKTIEALKAWPRCDLPGSGPSAVFSILDAKTRIPPHTGVNNARLIVHLPLIVPTGCGFRVGAETREWEPGKAFVFDDTIEHEAWNDSDVPRAVMIFDIWNPYVSETEREMVRALTVGVGDFYGALPSYV